MNLEELVDNPPQWLSGEGPLSEILLFVRMKLFRNLDGYIFPTKADDRELELVSTLVKDTLANSGYLKDALLISLADLSELDIAFVKERRLLKGDKNNSECIVSQGEKVNIRLNEDDHVRIESRVSGFDFTTLYNLAFEIDDMISSKLAYAFRDDYGYLTSCPTNLGTGLKLSCILHLPGLVLTKEVNKLLDDILERGLSFKGLFGKGGEFEGSFFQLGNIKTLGTDEEDIVKSIGAEVRTLIDLEKGARDRLTKEVGKRLEDKIWRAYGILKNARTLSQNEFINLSSAIRLGIGLHLIDDIELKKLNHLLLYTGSAHLQKLKGRVLEGDAKDVERANYVREVLG